MYEKHDIMSLEDIMKRLFEKELIQWKNDGCIKPMMVVGARQVGKTYLIQKFCKENYENCYFFDLAKDEDILSVFKNTIDPVKIIRQIQVIKNMKIHPEKDILFFDEIQNSERAIESMKYFCDYQKHYNIVCAGSLLGVKIHRMKSSFPVGKVEIRFMNPMNFKEFLMAYEQDDLIELIQDCFESKQSIASVIHDRANEFYRKYLYVGGMPEVVYNYIHNENIDSKLRENLITSYLADMSKYTENTESIKNIKIYQSIPAQLAKENTKFKYSLVDKSARAIRYESSLDWLIHSRMVLKCSHVTNTQIPLRAFEQDSVFKIYLSDCGLLSSLSRVEEKDIILDSLGMFFGALTENYVACEMNSYGNPLHYFTFSKYEIDFLLKIDSKIIPVEVKKGKNTSSKSLNNYIERYNPDYSIRLSMKNFGFENNIYSVPLYALFCILEHK